MNRYHIFIISFAISVLAFMVFMTTYLQGIFQVMALLRNHPDPPTDPSWFFGALFSPSLLISLFMLATSGLLYRVLGIIFIARHRRLDGGEQALWIIGFVLFGFITAIVFMALNKSRDLVSGGKNSVYPGA